MTYLEKMKENLITQIKALDASEFEIVRKKKMIVRKDSYCMQKVSCKKQGIFFLLK